jgi:acyl carrier protein phosphodiesterase
MNILAHLALSGKDAEKRFGNFIGDGIKGRNLDILPQGIRQGVQLHRFIDSRSETHASALELRRLLALRIGIFAPVALDILLDHLLALQWEIWYCKDLRLYTNQMYLELEPRVLDMPARQAAMLPYMIQYDWLFNYRSEEGIERSLRGLGSRIRSSPDLLPALDVFRENRSRFTESFMEFYLAIRADIRRNFGVEPLL